VLADAGLTAQDVAREVVELVARLEPQPDREAREPREA
jgi:hypothetical protein